MENTSRFRLVPVLPEQSLESLDELSSSAPVVLHERVQTQSCKPLQIGVPAEAPEESIEVEVDGVVPGPRGTVESPVHRVYRHLQTVRGPLPCVYRWANANDGT